MRILATALCLSMTIAASAYGAAHGQGATVKDAPRLDESGTAWGSIFNEGGLGIAGDNCQLLRVQAGEIWGIAASIPNQTPLLEMIDGARCKFAKETDALPKLTAAAPSVGGMAYIRVDRPGFYSVRVTAEDAERSTRVMLVAAKLDK